MIRRQHNRNPYWSAQYRRIVRVRKVNAILKKHYMAGIVDMVFARNALGLPEVDLR